MATKNFKGFQLVALATFNGADFRKDKDTLYFVRTSGDKRSGTDGFLYFNGKKYGTAEDAKAALITRYGDIKIGEKDATIADYVAEQLKDIKGVTKTDFDAVKAESAANKAAIEKLNGAEDAEGSVAKAVKDAKTSLVGTATEGYQTLGELETKIKDEASRADAAEKKNATAAANAKTAADKAQEAADAKVASVGVEGAIVKTGEATTPTIGLKLAEDQGNVVLSQENGLKAQIDLSAFGVKGVATGEKVISVSEGLLSSTLSLKYDSAAKKINLYGKKEDETNLISFIDATDFIKDGMLKSAKLKVFAEKIDETHPAGTYIVLTWNDDAQSGPMYINVSSLIDTYTAKADGGLVLEDHAFSVDTTKIATTKSVEDEVTRAKAAEKANKAGIDKLNNTHARVGGEGADKENFKTVADEVSAGIADIAEASVASAEGGDVKVTVTTKAGSVSAVAVDASVLAGKVSANDAAIKAEADTARKAEEANAAAITTLNGDESTPGSVSKKIKDALDAGAVTLEVKNNDAYLGVTSATTEGKGTVYTLASKEDAINNAIKAEADKVKVSVTNGTYVKGSVDEATGRVITLSEKVQAVADADADVPEKKGLAEASDVKAYVDGKVSGKNVTAEGESGDTALVSASADTNNVTVWATDKLKNAVTKAETSVQSVNGQTSSAVTLTGEDIATDQNVGGSETATVNAVLADIYTKLGVVVKADDATIKESAEHKLSVNLETIEKAQAAGHVALEHGTDGALYGVMYYSGDDVDDNVTA